MYLSKAKTRFEELGLASSECIPCTIEEVLALEQRLNLSLPEAYKEFLLWMGHGSPVLKGTNCFYEDLPNLLNWALELLDEDGFPKKLPDDAFIFLMHQGYYFMFLKISEGKDPPVYDYIEEIEEMDEVEKMMSRTSFNVRFSSFSEFLLSEIESHVNIMRRWGISP